MLKDLQCAWNLGFKYTELMVDSQIDVRMLLQDGNSGPSKWSLCQKIRRLLRLEWVMKTQHIYQLTFVHILLLIYGAR
jgi:hypothetical protein